jgi:uncharacterized membrane protein YhaH (DUF805 family)
VNLRNRVLLPQGDNLAIMEIWEATKLAFKNYATFTGKTSRPDYWYFILALFIVSAIASVISDDLGTIVAIATLIPWASASARRLRDAGKPMSNFFWLLLPFAGIIIFIVQLAQPTMPEHQQSS